MHNKELDPLRKAFYSRSPLSVARELIGKKLVRNLRTGESLEGIIVETEAYGGSRDPASHAFRGQTPRNSVMFGEPGRVYVYFTYGFHHCLNLVTGRFRNEAAGAVLVRALQPIRGISRMEHLRGTHDLLNLANGPGKVCQALSVDLRLNGANATSSGSGIHVEAQDEVPISTIRRSTRIGIKTGTDKLWRFYADGNSFVSREH